MGNYAHTLPYESRKLWASIVLVYCSYESGVLEDPSVAPPNGIYKITRDLKHAEEYLSTIDINFVKGTYNYKGLFNR